MNDLATVGISAFLVGVAFGIGLHRFIMAMVLDRSPDTLCAYCEWLGRKKKQREEGGGEDAGT